MADYIGEMNKWSNEREQAEDTPAPYPEPVEWILGPAIAPHTLSIRKCYGGRLPKEPMYKVSSYGYSGGPVLARDGTWEYEPQPSSRDHAFYNRCRFDTFEDALRAAQAAAQAL